MDTTATAFFIGVGVQIITAGVAIGMHRQTQKFQGERINGHDLAIARLETAKADQATTVQRLSELDREKVDVLFHQATVTRIEESIKTVSHRGANTEQRVYALETNRSGRS